MSEQEHKIDHGSQNKDLQSSNEKALKKGKLLLALAVMSLFAKFGVEEYDAKEIEKISTELEIKHHLPGKKNIAEAHIKVDNIGYHTLTNKDLDWLNNAGKILKAERDFNHELESRSRIVYAKTDKLHAVLTIAGLGMGFAGARKMAISRNKIGKDIEKNNPQKS